MRAVGNDLQVVDEKIRDFVSKWEGLELYDPSMNEELIQFVRSISMDSGGMEIAYDLSPNFENHLLIGGDDYLVFVWRNQQHDIVGTGSFTRRTGRMGDRAVQVGYFGGLRLSPRMERRQRVHWRKQYGELIELLSGGESSFSVDVIYTAILNKNIAAVKALTNSKQFSYVPVTSYHSYSLVLSGLSGIFKYFQKPSSFHVRKANESDSSKLANWIADREKVSRFSVYHDGRQTLGEGLEENLSTNSELSSSTHELSRRMERWKGFKIPGFYLVETGEGELVGSCAPYFEDSGRHLMVEKVPKHLKMASKWMRLWGRPSLEQGKPLRLLYLSHFYVDENLSSVEKVDVIMAVLDTIIETPEYAQSHSTTFIPPAIFSQQEIDMMKHKLQRIGAVIHAEAGTIYQVTCDSTRVRLKPSDWSTNLEPCVI